jgi:hypothetical protein
VIVYADATAIAEIPSPGPDFCLVPRARPSGDRRALAPRTADPLRAALSELSTALPSRSRRHPWRRPYNVRLAIQAGYTDRRG